MLKTFLAVAVLVFILGVTDVHAVPDDGSRGGQVSNQQYSDTKYYRENGQFRGSDDYEATQSGSLYDAVGGENASTASAETKCIAAGATLAECGLGGGGGSGSGSSGGAATPAQAAEAKSENQKKAVKDYVNLHKMNGFDLGRLNSDREATLVISNSNAENNVVFRIIRLIGMLVGTVAILLYIVAGYFMIFSMGDENSLTKGKQIVTYTSLGLIIAFTAYMIVQLVMGLMYFAG